MTPTARRIAALAVLLVALAGCGRAQPAAISVPVGIAAEPLARAVLIYGGPGAQMKFAAAPASRYDPFVVASSGNLLGYVQSGFVVIGSACARPPEVLLWHYEETFAWSDVGGMPLYDAPGSDPSMLHLALSRYRGIVKDLKPPLPAAGGVRAFLEEPEGFLLAPEPLGSALIANGQGLLAQALADELGPFPGCFILARASVLRRDPQLAVRLLETVDMSLFELRIARPTELALVLRPLWPTTSYRGIERALSVAQRSGIWPDSAYLSPDALRSELADLGESLPRGGLSDRYAREALVHPFAP